MKKGLAILFTALIVLCIPMETRAQSLDSDFIYEEFDLQGIQKELNQMTPDYSVELNEILGLIMSGKLGECFQKVLELIGSAFLDELHGMKFLFAAILSLGIISALLSNFAGLMSNHQIADISFYFTYLLLITILMNSFSQAADIMESVLNNITLFMQLFLPTYFIAMGVGAGLTTAAVYGNLLLFFIYFLEKIMKIVALPAIYSYVFLNILNGLWIEEKLNTLLELLKKGIKLLFKGILTFVTGISVIQSMITPVIDSLKSTTVQKVISAIPGIGNITSTITEMVIGSAVLVKNSVGVLMMFGLLLICVAPIIKIFMIAAIIKLSAGLIGIVSDKRITNCTDKLGDGSFLLMEAGLTSMTLFLITIAIVSWTANRGF